MLLGLTCAPGAFQQPTDLFSTKLRGLCALVYLNRIVIFSQTPIEFIDPVRHGFMLLYDFSVIVDLNKCEVLAKMHTAVMSFAQDASKG